MANPDIYPNPTYKGPGGIHPASSTDNGLARYDGTTGALQGGGTYTLSDAGALVTATGSLSVASGTDASTTLGQTLIDSRSAGIVFISHLSANGPADYALQQNGSGRTIVNSKSGQVLRLAINNAAQLEIAAGSVTVSDAVDFVLNTSTGTSFGTGATQKLSFYGVTPVAQQTGVAVSAAGIHAACVSLGLFTA